MAKMSKKAMYITVGVTGAVLVLVGILAVAHHVHKHGHGKKGKKTGGLQYSGTTMYHPTTAYPRYRRPEQLA